MSKDYKRLINISPSDFVDGGIFFYIPIAAGATWNGSSYSGGDCPWQDLDYSYLNMDYYGNQSGDKIISPLLEKFLELDDADTLTVIRMQHIANILWHRFGDKWLRLWEVLTAEYDPISNYDMEEKMTNDQTTHQKGSTNTRTLNTNKARTGTDTSDSSVYGFDSSNAAPSGKEQVTLNNNEADTGTITDVGSGTDTDTRNYTLTRSGNIGVTTSQQMLQSEIDLWQWDFFQTVFRDIDKIMTLAIY